MRVSTLTLIAATVLFPILISPSAAQPITKKSALFDKNGTTDPEGNLVDGFGHFGRGFCHTAGMGCIKRREVVPIQEATTSPTAALLEKVLVATNEGVAKRDVHHSELFVAAQGAE